MLKTLGTGTGVCFVGCIEYFDFSFLLLGVPFGLWVETGVSLLLELETLEGAGLVVLGLFADFS